MANHTTGAQRRNKRMDAIFAKSDELNKKYGNAPGLHSTPQSKALGNVLKGKLDKDSGARNVTKAYKKKNPNSNAHGVHDVMRKD